MGATFLSVGLAGCIVGDNHCSANQVAYRDHLLEYCTCAPNAIPASDGVGCVACGEHQVVESNTCVCATGYVRASDTAPCEAVPEGTVALSQACHASGECGGDYPYCAPTEDAGYCTAEGCSADSECPSYYWCDASGDKSYCHRPPTGLGKTCGSDTDCKGFEASHCETLQARVCMVSDCATGNNPCHGANACCDLGTFVPGLSLCIPHSELKEGVCPDGRAPVKP
jgi:hypothetical protein